jgi:hypothetical protein
LSCAVQRAFRGAQDRGVDHRAVEDGGRSECRGSDDAPRLSHLVRGRREGGADGRDLGRVDREFPVESEAPRLHRLAADDRRIAEFARGAVDRGATRGPRRYEHARTMR